MRHTTALSVKLVDEWRGLVDVSITDLEIGRCEGEGQIGLARSTIEDRSVPSIYFRSVEGFEYRFTKSSYRTRTQKASLSPMCISKGPTTKPRP